MKTKPQSELTPERVAQHTEELPTVFDQPDTNPDEGIVKNIDELKELIEEGKTNLVDPEGTPLTTEELKELVDPDKPAMKPEDLP